MQEERSRRTNRKGSGETAKPASWKTRHEGNDDDVKNKWRIQLLVVIVTALAFRRGAIPAFLLGRRAAATLAVMIRAAGFFVVGDRRAVAFVLGLGLLRRLAARLLGGPSAGGAA